MAFRQTQFLLAVCLPIAHCLLPVAQAQAEPEPPFQRSASGAERTHAKWANALFAFASSSVRPFTWDCFAALLVSLDTLAGPAGATAPGPCLDHHYCLLIVFLCPNRRVKVQVQSHYSAPTTSTSTSTSTCLFLSIIWNNLYEISYTLRNCKNLIQIAFGKVV